MFQVEDPEDRSDGPYLVNTACGQTLNALGNGRSGKHERGISININSLKYLQIICFQTMTSCEDFDPKTLIYIGTPELSAVCCRVGASWCFAKLAL